MTGFLSAKSALKTNLADDVIDAGKQGGLAAGCTGLIYTLFLGLCVTVTLSSVEEQLNDIELSLIDLAKLSDSTGVATSVICLASLAFSILIYGGLGALGGVVAGIRDD